MDKKEKFQAIKEETNNFLNTIKQMESSEIKQVDIDLLRMKFTTIYDKILTLIQEKDVVLDIPPKDDVLKEKPETTMEYENKPVEEKQTVVVEQETEIKFGEEQKITPDEKKPYVPEIDFVTEDNIVTKNEKKTIGESFQKKKSLNDLISEIKKDKEIGTGLNFLKIDNLSHAISINDKIEFVRELFNNDTDRYAETIQKINNQKDLDSAIFELTDLDFDNEKPAAKKFLNLVYRKFLDE